MRLVVFEVEASMEIEIDQRFQSSPQAQIRGQSVILRSSCRLIIG